MSRITKEQMSVFESAVASMFPGATTLNKEQIRQVQTATGVDKHPGWMIESRVGRGVFALKARLKPVVEPKLELVSNKHTSTLNTIDITGFVPKIDEDYVPFGVYKDLDVIVKSKKFYPAYISGPTGNGKSTTVEQICAKRDVPLIRININNQTDEEHLIGSKTLVDGNVKIVEGPIIIAMRQGMTVLLDEIDAGAPNTLLCLQSILEGKPFYFKLKNEIVTPKEGFNIIATANSKGKGSDDGRYIGVNILNDAFLERFAISFVQDYPNVSIETDILKKAIIRCGLDVESNLGVVDSLVKWAHAIRKTFEDGGVDELITTRRLVHIVKAYSMYKNINKAVQLCVNRFDDSTRTAFISLFEKVCVEVPEQELAV